MSSDLKNVPDFMSAVALVVARIALKMPTERRQYFVEGDGRRELEDGLSLFFEGAIEEDLPVPVLPQYPANDEIFDIVVVDPTTGLEVIRHFKLVKVGYQKNWQSLQDALAPHGAATGEPERAAFKKKFSQADGNGPIGFAKAPLGRASFPYVFAGGGARFRWTDCDFRARWRWLVEVQAKA